MFSSVIAARFLRQEHREFPQNTTEMAFKVEPPASSRNIPSVWTNQNFGFNRQMDRQC